MSYYRVNNNLRFCIIGRGSIGTRHIKNLKRLSYDNIVAYSQHPDKKKDEYFLKHFNINTFYDLDSLSEYKPDIFIIANPTSEHVKMAKIAIDLGAHIVMEKPISDNLLKVDEIKELLNINNLHFFLANNLRFHPAIKKIKSMIDNHDFGEIYFARLMVGQYLPDWHPSENYRNSYSAKRKLGGGVVLTLQHEIDYAYWLFGRFKTIKSFTKKISSLHIDVEAIASIIIETEAGSLIEIHLDYLQRPAKRSFSLQGSNGSIDYVFGDDSLLFYDFDQQKSKEILDLKNYDNNQMYIDELDYFIKCICKEKKTNDSLDEAIYVLNSCMKIKKDLNI